MKCPYIKPHTHLVATSPATPLLTYSANRYNPQFGRDDYLYLDEDEEYD